VLESLRPVAVVGQQQQPLRVTVQAAYRVETTGAAPERLRHQLQHCPLGVPVGDRRGDAGRLVEDEVEVPAGGVDGPPTDGDPLHGRVHALSDRGRHAVHGHAAGRHERLRGPA